VAAVQDAIAEAESGAASRADLRVLGTIDQQRGSGAATTLAFAEMRVHESAVHLKYYVLGDTQVMLVRGTGSDPVEQVSHPKGSGGGRAPDQVGATRVHGLAYYGEIGIGLDDWVVVGTDGAVEAPIRARSKAFAEAVRAWRPADSDLRRLLRPLLQARVTGTFAARDDRTAVFVGPAAGRNASEPGEVADRPEEPLESTAESATESAVD
jgi:hypothetical protein